jgi:hypothetical protein
MCVALKCSSHKLPIEKGRFLSIDRSEQICTLCNKHKMGGEFHYLFYCSHFTQAKCRFLPQQLIDCPYRMSYGSGNGLWVGKSHALERLIVLDIFWDKG